MSKDLEFGPFERGFCWLGVGGVQCGHAGVGGWGFWGDSGVHEEKGARRSVLPPKYDMKHT